MMKLISWLFLLSAALNLFTAAQWLAVGNGSAGAQAFFYFLFSFLLAKIIRENE